MSTPTSPTSSSRFLGLARQDYNRLLGEHTSVYLSVCSHTHTVWRWGRAAQQVFSDLTHFRQPFLGLARQASRPDCWQSKLLCFRYCAATHTRCPACHLRPHPLPAAVPQPGKTGLGRLQVQSPGLGDDLQAIQVCRDILVASGNPGSSDQIPIQGMNDMAGAATGYMT
ncbi:MAG: hypothetical protein LQ344_007355 [Seirophora lacunosa]|nr:MAG: hypothetical protein LQ344_007355 [Seirophora lacunosa]